MSYIKGLFHGLGTLLTGMKVTGREFFTKKVTEQYPENRKTTLHVAQRHRGRLVFKRNEDEAKARYEHLLKLIEMYDD